MPRKRPQVLGASLNRSESSPRHGSSLRGVISSSLRRSSRNVARCVTLPTITGSDISGAGDCERAHLVQSERHLAQARRIVLQQEQLIEHLAASGHDTRDANSFLP